MGQFFLGGAEPSLSEKFFDSTRKTSVLTYKITLPDSSHPVIISKNADFGHFVSPDRMNSIFSFNKYKKYTCFNFGCWFLSEKFSFCPKNNGFARVRGAEAPPQSPGTYAYAHKCNLHVFIITHKHRSTN